MSLEKFGFGAAASLSSSSSSNTPTSNSTSYQDILTHIGSLLDTTTALHRSLLGVENKVQNLPLAIKTKCPSCAALRHKLFESNLELRKRKSHTEMIKKIKTLEDRVKALESENFRLKFLKDNDNSNNNNNNNHNNNNKNNNNKEKVIEDNNNNNNI
jgi:hypothetical protein